MQSVTGIFKAAIQANPTILRIDFNGTKIGNFNKQANFFRLNSVVTIAPEELRELADFIQELKSKN